jgi:hypothetical protein
MAFANNPVTLIGPTPALLQTYNAGLSNTLVYTIINKVPKNLPLVLSGIYGLVSRTPVANDCGNILPARSACNIGIAIAPTAADMGSFIYQVLQVYYDGRLPLTSPISFTVSTQTPPPPPQPTTPVFGYVSDLSSKIFQCPIDLTTGNFLSPCITLTNIPPFSQTNNTTFNIFGGVTYLYVGAQGASILWKCPINNATGGFSGPCTALTNIPSFNRPIDAAFDSSSGITYAYVSDLSNRLWQCPINTITGNFSAPCIALTNPGFNQTNSTVFQTFGGVKYAYVADTSLDIWQCPIDPVSGGFSGPCIANTLPTLSGGTSSIIFNTFSGITYAYVGGSVGLWKCSINTITGSFSSCVALSDPSLATPSELAFKTFSGITYAYISNVLNILQCPIDTATGNFAGPCLPFNEPDFFFPINITFNL